MYWLPSAPFSPKTLPTSSPPLPGQAPDSSFPCRVALASQVRAGSKLETLLVGCLGGGFTTVNQALLGSFFVHNLIELLQQSWHVDSFSRVSVVKNPHAVQELEEMCV